MLKFLLDGSGGALAFKKEEDTATFPDDALLVDVDDPSLPGAVSSAVDVSGYRSAVTTISCSDPATTYDLEFYMSKKTGTVTDEFFKFEEISSKKGNSCVGISVDLFDYLFVLPVNIAGGTVTVEIGLAHWDES